jgi:hypothetical protein
MQYAQYPLIYLYNTSSLQPLKQKQAKIIPSHANTKNALKTPCPSQSLLKLRSKHPMRSNRAAIVLGSEIAALGRYERVPLREESDSYSSGLLAMPFAVAVLYPLDNDRSNGRPGRRIR